MLIRHLAHAECLHLSCARWRVGKVVLAEFVPFQLCSSIDVIFIKGISCIDFLNESIPPLGLRVARLTRHVKHDTHVALPMPLWDGQTMDVAGWSAVSGGGCW